MSENELNETQPNAVKGDTRPQPAVTPPQKAGRKEKKSWNAFPRWLAALVVVLVIVIGVLSGYGSGMAQRYDARSTQVSGQLADQFVRGMEALDAGQYDLAKTYFDYIMGEDPNYPGVQTAYTELLLRMQISPTPTYTPTPTITPTPDLRGAEEIFNSARQALANSDWDGAITNLDNLRKIDMHYRAAEVDGMYYTALRMRGISKILTTDCQAINLEGGIFDLSLAERFGPLDGLAAGLRTDARLYIIGASYWDQDWDQAQYYFYQVMALVPNLADSSCMTATERWRYATIKVAERLLAAGDVCGAEAQFTDAFSIGSQKNEAYYPTATQVSHECDGPDNNQPAPTAEGTPTEVTPTEPPVTAPPAGG